MSSTLKALQARLDSQAIEQLRNEVTALASKVEALETENAKLQNLWQCEIENAVSWREDYFNLCETNYPDAQHGITQNGQSVLLLQQQTGGTA